MRWEHWKIEKERIEWNGWTERWPKMTKVLINRPDLTKRRQHHPHPSYRRIGGSVDLGAARMREVMGMMKRTTDTFGG